jgi:hypothetical protein
MRISQRLTALELSNQPARFLIVLPEQEQPTPDQLATWHAANPHGTVIRVQYPHDEALYDDG